MQFFRKMGVYEKVPRAMAWKLGCKVITTKWLDTNKCDESTPNYRSRLVGREVKMDRRMDLFSATPPLESLKMLLSVCARGQAQPRPLRLAVIDIKRAYFYAPVRRPVFIEIPPEDREPGDEASIGKLRLSLYGTRDAAQNWAHEYTTFLRGLGFEAGRSSPCNFRHDKKDISLTVHGDDFTIVANDEQLEYMGKKFKERYEVKMDILGPSQPHLQEVRVLNRIIRWGTHGLEYEPDQRHAEKVVSDLQLEKAKPVSTPWTDEQVKQRSVNPTRDEPLSEMQMRNYRGIAARINYLASDRADLLFASKCASQWMSAPTIGAWENLKRIGRYLKGVPRIVQHFPWSGHNAEVSGYADSDWAGDRHTLKSTSGGTIMWGSHCLKSWSTTQSTRALSSGEAELYAMTRLAVQVAGIISLATDFGIELQGAAHSDSNAAIGIAHRDGLSGRCRHIRLQYLWIQERIKGVSYSYARLLRQAIWPI